jgi:CheY-like chemotaxis protein
VLRKRKQQKPTPTLEEVRRQAKILIIDDEQVPFQPSFIRDGYHVERWTTIRNLSQLTDANFDLILLDLHGVGLKDSPGLQGFGILEHLKQRNPAQLVVAYSAKPWGASFQRFFFLADAVLDKGDEYVKYKETVDSQLMRRYSPGYFVARINEALGDQAIYVPRIVAKAVKAIQDREVAEISRYLAGRLKDEATFDRVIAILGIAIKVLG